VVSQHLPPYQQLVDGEVLPAALAGAASLDFCNTLAGRGGASPREYLTDYRRLVLWAGAAGLLADDERIELERLARRSPRRAEAALRAAKQFREAFYAVCTGDVDGAWPAVAAAVERAAARARLAPPAREAAAQWSLPRELGLRLPLDAVALAACELLLDRGVRDVRRCPGRGCGWLFLDPTGRRRWCSMAACGNREKVRRHAERHRVAR
jgi:predicted RNA-binding Zn ribbon-like protein